MGRISNIEIKKRTEKEQGFIIRYYYEEEKIGEFMESLKKKYHWSTPIKNNIDKIAKEIFGIRKCFCEGEELWKPICSECKGRKSGETGK